MPSPRSARRTPLAVLALAALAAVATLLAPGLASAASGRPTLTIRSLDTHTKLAPARVIVKTASANTLRARLNGKDAGDAFRKHSRNRSVGELTVNDGLRLGRNRLRLTATRPNGAARTITRTFTVTKRLALADAGDDTTARRGEPTEIGTARGGIVAAGVRAKIHWTVASRPQGAKVTLQDADDASPTIVADRTGTYVLRMTSDPAGPPPPSRDTVTVAVTPNDDPPIGIPFETLSGRDDGAIRIDGAPVPDTYGRGGIFVVVLERATRKVVQYGTTPRHGGGLDQLIAIADRWGGRDKYLMMVSGYNGIDKSDLDRANTLAKRLGNGDLSTENRVALSGGLPFSMVGVAGGVEGSGWTRIPGGYSDPVSGNLTGMVQRNAATAQYDLVNQEHPTYDTVAQAGLTTANVVRVGAEQYTATLPAGRTAGFQLVSLESLSLRLLGNDVYPIDGQNGAASEKAFADALKTAVDRPGRGIVIVQSIGKPKGVTETWNQALDQLDRLDATRALTGGTTDGANGYTIVARRHGERPPVEASTIPNPGNPDAEPEPARLTGFLTRTRTSGFEAYSSSPFASGNTDLTNITYQPAQAFPAFSAGGEKAAEAWIGVQLNFCNAGATECDMRRMYYDRYRSEWIDKSSALRTMPYPGDGHGFVPGDFTKVRDQLKTEVTALVAVKNYFEQLQRIFPRAESAGQVDLKKIAKDLYDSLQPSPATEEETMWTEGLEKSVEVAKVFFGDQIGVMESVNAVFQLVGFLADPHGKPVAGEQVKVRADALATQLPEMLSQAQEALVSQSQLIVSDWGKLQAVAGHVDKDWALPASDAQSLQALRLGMGQWAAGELFPAAYRDLLHTRFNLTPSQTSCGFEPFLGHYYQRHPWNGLEESLSAKGTQGIRGSSPVWTHWFAVAGGRAPRGNVGTLMFNDPDERTPGLGIDRLRFFTKRNFHGQDLYANDAEPYCNLPFSHHVSDWYRN